MPHLSSVGCNELESHAGRCLDGQIAGQSLCEALDEGVAAGHDDGPVEGRPQIDVAVAEPEAASGNGNYVKQKVDDVAALQATSGPASGNGKANDAKRRIEIEALDDVDELEVATREADQIKVVRGLLPSKLNVGSPKVLYPIMVLLACYMRRARTLWSFGHDRNG